MLFCRAMIYRKGINLKVRSAVLNVLSVATHLNNDVIYVTQLWE